MAYDRYGTRGAPRDERPRWSEGRQFDRYSNRGQRDERGFFERAGDEIASWFGDEDADRRRHTDQMPERRAAGDPYRERDWDRQRELSRGQVRNWNDNRGLFASGGSSEPDSNPAWKRELSGRTARYHPPEHRPSFAPSTYP